MKNRDPDSFFFFFLKFPSLGFFILPVCVCVSCSRSQLICFAGYPSVCICLTPSLFQVRPREILLARVQPRQGCVLISGGVRDTWDGLSCYSKFDSLAKVDVCRVSLYSTPLQSLTPLCYHPLVMFTLAK